MEDIQCLIKESPPCQTYTVYNEAGHGRIANRTTSVYQKKLDDLF